MVYVGSGYSLSLSGHLQTQMFWAMVYAIHPLPQQEMCRDANHADHLRPLRALPDHRGYIRQSTE